MPTKIRLQKTGKRGIKTFRVVVVNEQSKRDGKVIENLGIYLPGKKTVMEIDKKAANDWIKKGAVCSATVKKLLDS